MPTINGKQVIFFDKMPSSVWWPLLPKIAELAQVGKPLTALGFDDICKMVAGSVRSWEFEGDPTDPEAVSKLDPFVELLPLIRAIDQVVGERMPSGEAASAST